MASAATRRATLTATVAAAGIVQLPTAAIVVALPTIHGQFDASMAELQWTVTAFYIPFAAFLIVAGRAADVFGRRRMLLGGAALFAAGGVVSFAAPDVQVLIAGIAFSGIGGALLMPSSMSLLTNVFTGAGRGLAIGMWGAATELVSGIGVVVGGVLTGDLSWRWIFGLDVIVAVAIALLAIGWTPESRDPNASRAGSEKNLPGGSPSVAAGPSGGSKGRGRSRRFARDSACRHPCSVQMSRWLGTTAGMLPAAGPTPRLGASHPPSSSAIRAVARTTEFETRPRRGTTSRSCGLRPREGSPPSARL